MAPAKSPWKHNPKNGTPKNDFSPGNGKPSFPVPVAQPGSEYAKEQDDEIEVLQAIYMEDFEQVELKGAWSKTTDRAFKLHLKAFSKPEISVLLSVRLTATYPKSLPLLSLEKAEHLREKTRQRIEKVIETTPKELAGQVMIHDIASAIQEILEDEVLAREQQQALPSLEEERAEHEAAAEKLAQKQEEQILKEKEKEREEEERVLKQMVDEEVSRRREMKRRNRPAVPQSLVSSESLKQDQSSNIVPFDRNVSIEDDGNTIMFDSVRLVARFAKGPVTELFTATPVHHRSVLLSSFILKRVQLSSTSSTESRLKKAILDFEDELEDLKRIRQENIISLLDFKLEKLESDVAEKGCTWHLDVLVECANKGSLTDMLDIMEALPVDRVRSWSVDLLEALDFYHRNGIVHKRVHTSNILICRPETGGTVVKLSDGGFQETLHELTYLTRKASKTASARSAYWIAPELSHGGTQRPTRKTDVWDLGIVFIQMLFGLEAPQKYTSPSSLMDALELSEPLQEIIRRFFKPDPKKRPSAFDIIPSEFLRNNVPVIVRPVSPLRTRRTSVTTGVPMDRRARRESSSAGVPFSRYANEWVEVGRLGKGGYGEVVKARNKLDGRIYAIKKIKQNSASALTEVLSEVMLLSRLNHPYVVRYYSAWPEDDFSNSTETEGESTLSPAETSLVTTEDAEGEPTSSAFTSTGGLDFISSSGYPKIEFGEDSDGSEEDDGIVFEEDGDSEDETGDEAEDDGTERSLSPNNMRRPPSSLRARRVRTTLYIQMEYCERHTLRDLIRKGLYDNPDEVWRLFRQILEGLAHIHSHGIIHRDLKPDNVFIDVANNPRIGDFGLATSGQYQLADKAVAGSNADGDMTRSIGTTLYVAPELKSGAGGTYNDKVDMYSLGIIFFEMCYPLRTAMERDQVIRKLREKQHTLPPEFQNPDKALQGSIILSLISHRPSERPGSSELLRSGKLPLQIEDETIREALKGLSDPHSPYYQRMMSALFSQTPNKQVKDFAWDAAAGSAAHNLKANDVLLQGIVKDRLTSIFRRHGALENQRQLLLPRSPYYTNSNVVQLFDASGTLVQLPYDLTLPYARAIAKQEPPAEKTFTIGHVFRDTFTGGAPRTNGEADFDITSYDTLDLALKEAEVIKVIDEVIDEFPSLSTAHMCFHLSHSDLLELIMGYCRINAPQRPAVKEILSKLNIHDFTWQKIKNELRSPTIGVSSTSLDDLAKFDWRDTPEKAFAKIRSLFQGTEYLDKTHAVFAHLSTVITYMKQFKVNRKIYISPLSCFNEKFYTGGILFQCLYDTKRRDVLAAGGRYDKLIEEHRPKVQGHFTGCHAVGMNLGWDRLVTSMAKYQKNLGKTASFLKKSTEEELGGQWATRRCDILVASFDSAVLRSAGVKMVGDLWAHDLSAELAVDVRSPEELLSHYRDDKHSWIVIIKHDAPGTSKPELKVKSLLRKEDTDIRSSDLIPYLRSELREREHREAAYNTTGIGIGSSTTTRQTPRLLRNGGSTGSSSGPANAADPDTPKAPVSVLTAQHRSKKTNKWAIVASAQARAQSLLASYSTAPIAAVETKDEVMELIRETRLSDPDSWRKVVQSVPLAEREYLQEIHDMLLGYARGWKEEQGGAPDGRVAFVYNFRTGGCVLYDLGL